MYTYSVRRDVPVGTVGVPLDLSTPTGMSCIGPYGEKLTASQTMCQNIVFY